MFYNEVVNEWGELTYVPTFLGKAVLVAILLVLLGLSLVIVKNRENYSKRSVAISTKQLTFSAMAIALGFILSTYFKFSPLPTGGDITFFSMLVICLPAYWYGIGPGIITGVAFGLLNLIMDPYVIHPAQLVVDYFLAFGALGLCGIFHNSKNGLLKGYIVGVIGRYVFAVISGWIFFGYYAWDGWGALPYSLVYNMSYILPEAAATVILLAIPAIRKTMIQLKDMATS
ncbi:MAG: energy-coupled thiamine transporter ThiT [Pseudobutyrivibrio sp.]|nr:energy-coupled thiamine transporter ThiT [Pseudobutyrivibrio sp.]